MNIQVHMYKHHQQKRNKDKRDENQYSTMKTRIENREGEREERYYEEKRWIPIVLHQVIVRVIQ